MRNERVVLKSMLSDSKLDRMRYQTQINTLVKEARALLYGFEYRKIEEVDIPLAAERLAEAAAIKEKLDATAETIAKMEKDLSDG